MSKISLLISLPLLSGFVPLAKAQSQLTDSTVYRLGEVQIQATRIPEVKTNAAASVTVIDSKQIAEVSRIAPDMSHLLGLLTPSLALSSNTTSSRSQTLRGRSVLVLIDGIPQSTPLRATDREMRTIDPSAVERIEVIKGANAIYGNGAIGGIINIVTKRNSHNKTIGGRTKEQGKDWDGYMSSLSIPAPKMTMHLHYSPVKHAYLMLQYLHTGSRNRFAPNAKGVYNEGEGIVKPIDVFNLSAGINFKHWHLNLGIENLLNKSYYTPASMLMARDAEYARANGRYMTLTATYKY